LGKTWSHRRWCSGRGLRECRRLWHRTWVTQRNGIAVSCKCRPVGERKVARSSLAVVRGTRFVVKRYVGDDGETAPGARFLEAHVTKRWSRAHRELIERQGVVNGTRRVTEAVKGHRQSGARRRHVGRGKVSGVWEIGLVSLGIWRRRCGRCTVLDRAAGRCLPSAVVAVGRNLMPTTLRMAGRIVLDGLSGRSEAAADGAKEGGCAVLLNGT